MFTQMVHYFYPDLKREEIKKFGLLALTFFFTIGAYWALRLLKDVIFFKYAFPSDLGWLPNQGALFQPQAKKWSIVVVIALVAVYTKLIDMFEKHKLFYILCTAYAILFTAITIVLFAQATLGDAYLGKTVLATMGWVSYFAIESFGSILVAFFWSFTSSITVTDAAKRGYPLIIAGAQVGAILGSALNWFSSVFAPWKLFAVCTLSVVAIMAVISYFMRVIPEEQRVGNKAAHATEKEKEGFFEGLFAGVRLLLTRRYLLGILIVSTFYEVVNTIVDYQMKAQAGMHPYYADKAHFQEFLSMYGMATNTLALFMALLGTSYLIKRFGLIFGLLFFPTGLGLALGGLYMFFQGSPTPSALLWATFGVMMLAKGISYAVSNPTKEMMYIPTSKDVKFKAKGVIDTLGSRAAKAGGSQVSDMFKHSLADLMTYGTLLSFGLIGIWFAAALFVGRKNAKLTSEGKIVE